MTHQLQITKSRKGLCFFLCPQGFNPKCVFFFLSSFPTEPKLKEIPPQKNKSPQPFSTNWLFAKLMLIDIGISIEHNHNRAQTIGIQALFLQCLPSYLSHIFSFTWFQEVYNFFFFNLRRDSGKQKLDNFTPIPTRIICVIPAHFTELGTES